MELITSAGDVVANIMTLDGYRKGSPQERRFHKSKIKNGKLFVVIRDGDQHLFAPSKFAGYAVNDFLHDEQLRERDGRDTNKRLDALFGSPLDRGDMSYDEIDRSFLAYCETNDIVPSSHHRTRRYWVVSGEARSIEGSRPTKPNPDWTRDELIVALSFYLRYRERIPGKTSREISELSDQLSSLGRLLHGTSSSTFRNINGVYMKLMNFRRLDPEYTGGGGVGLTRGSHTDQFVWDEFYSDQERLQSTADTILDATNRPDSDDADNAGSDVIVEAVEGRVITKLHTTRERNRSLVKQKKAEVLRRTGRLECEGCGFDFEKTYGERGRGFAECHHVQPLSRYTAGQKTLLADLAVICANCHRMIHADSRWLTIAQLKDLLR